jgi:large subunit ribosomal protein L32
MAVPKKRTSDSKTNSRRAVWKRKAKKAADKALSNAKSILKFNSKQYVEDLTSWDKTDFTNLAQQYPERYVSSSSEETSTIIEEN